MSNTLQALAGQFHRFAESSGVIMSPETAATYGRVFANLADEATALEEATANAFAVHGIPADILKIATMLARHGVSAGLPAHKRGGGAA